MESFVIISGVITAKVGIIAAFIIMPYYIYQLAKGLLTHHAELKHKYDQPNNGKTESDF